MNEIEATPETLSENDTLCGALEKVQKNWDLSNLQMAKLAHIDLQLFTQRMLEDRNDPASPTIPPGMGNAVPLISIYKALERRFPRVEDRMKWLFKKNTDFGDNKPIDIVASSVGNLFWVSYYLNSDLLTPPSTATPQR